MKDPGGSWGRSACWCRPEAGAWACRGWADRKSTRLNSSHLGISYAVFCLKKKTKKKQNQTHTKTTTQKQKHKTTIKINIPGMAQTNYTPVVEAKIALTIATAITERHSIVI